MSDLEPTEEALPIVSGKQSYLCNCGVVIYDGHDGLVHEAEGNKLHTCPPRPVRRDPQAR